RPVGGSRKGRNSQRGQDSPPARGDAQTDRKEICSWLANSEEGRPPFVPLKPPVLWRPPCRDTSTKTVPLRPPVVPPPAQVAELDTYTDSLQALADWLKQRGVTTVALEATGVYWGPLFATLEERGFEVILVAPTYTSGIKGRGAGLL